MTDAKAGPPGECNFQPFSGPSLSIPCLAHVGSMATAILFSRNEVGQTEPLRLAQRLAHTTTGDCTTIRSWLALF